LSGLDAALGNPCAENNLDTGACLIDDPLPAGRRHHADEFCFDVVKTEKSKRRSIAGTTKTDLEKAIVKEALRPQLAEWLKISSAGGWQPKYRVVALGRCRLYITD
jgi:hypothetical protein